MKARLARHTKKLFSDYGMLGVLLVLCAAVSAATVDEQFTEGADAGEEVAELAQERLAPGARVLVVARKTEIDAAFAEEAVRGLEEAGFEVAGTVLGGPPHAVRELKKIERAGGPLGAVVTVRAAAASWAPLKDLAGRFPGLGETALIAPEGKLWPTFLTAGNIRAVGNRTVVIAVIAIGMTMVIITAGIDLSVGSLIALSSVVTAWLLREAFGAEDAGTAAMITASAAGISACALTGLGTGALVAFCRVPPFIVTLAMMLIASGLAFIIAGGESIPQVPQSFVWLGLGTAPGGIPNAVLLTLFLYALAHVLMTRTPLGRYIYAVGGNPEAARLSGVPVRAVILFVYALSGLLAGLGGVITASKLRSGDPTLGQFAELDVIAAVVVGGTSLAGGEGKVFGTLVGALIIGVILNAMNLLGVESYTQKVVLGAVILAAVLLDRAKRKLMGG